MSMSMSIMSTRALVAIGSAGVASIVSADVISYTHDFTPDGRIHADLSNPTGTSNLKVENAFDSSFWLAELSQFDLSLGTLTGAVISIDLEFGAIATTSSSSGGSITQSFGGPVDVEGITYGNVGTGGGNGGGPSSVITLATTVSDVYSVPVGSDGIGISLETAMTGTGTWTWSYRPTVDEFNWVASMTDVAFWLEDGASVSVEYTYEPSNAVVPGPMAAAALAAVGLVGRRRRR